MGLKEQQGWKEVTDGSQDYWGGWMQQWKRM